jgi:phosphatidylcholine synthase
VLIVLTFVPFNVIHPVRVTRLRALTLFLIGLWAVLAIVALVNDFNVVPPVTIALCAIAVYVVACDAVIRMMTSRSASA